MASAALGAEMLAVVQRHAVRAAGVSSLIAAGWSWSHWRHEEHGGSSSSQARRASSSHSWSSPAQCEEGQKFEVIQKEKFLNSKKAASTEYLATEGGMRFCDLKVGQGEVAERGVLVGVHFEGNRLNGRQLESSWQNGPTPIYIEAGSTPEFPALGEGVIGMREGGRRELIVPPSMNRAGVQDVTVYKVDLFVVSSQRGKAAATRSQDLRKPAE
eukprot:TRINITY_DN75235_c0_g1_i1.p1 TRINITY_DN75235_c0_g1~~TRINITY_DN75235_c0_g1_i1.p1  ORF type:complete len:214 (+),score=46.42 TRINITY_DN75235_c0_g1_i1:45-686(+)